MADEPYYPSEYPRPDDNSYSGQIDAHIIHSSVATPSPNQRKGFNSSRVVMSLTFTLQESDFFQWVNWANINVWDWFHMELVTPRVPVNILAWHRVRFTSDLSIRLVGYGLSAVTVEAELIPGDVPADGPP